MIAFLHSSKKKLGKTKPDTKKITVFFLSVRLFSTKSFKPLGTLVHHKAAVQALAFAHVSLPTTQRHHHRRHRHNHHHQQKEYDHCRCRHAGATDGGDAGAYSGATKGDTADIGEIDEDEDNEDDEMTVGEKARRARWLVSGGKDGRVVIWELMDFNGARSAGLGHTKTAKE